MEIRGENLEFAHQRSNIENGGEMLFGCTFMFVLKLALAKDVRTSIRLQGHPGR